MGIQLLTRLAKEEGLLVDENFSGCHVVVDADNIMLYMEKVWFDGISSPLGNDLAFFADRVEHFFSDLKRCGIRPVVVMESLVNYVDNYSFRYADGRMRSKMSYRDDDGRPPVEMATMLWLTFSQVLHRMGIPLARIDGDADPAAAALARRLGCAVLTDDSDFWLLGVPCVRVENGFILARRPTLQLRHGFSMNVQVFRPERFESHFQLGPGMVSLFAAMAGMNSYIPIEVCDTFVSQLMPSELLDNHLRRLRVILGWLREQATAENALKTLLDNLSEGRQRKVTRFLELHRSWRDGDGISLDWLEDAAPAVHRLLRAPAPGGSGADRPADSTLRSVANCKPGSESAPAAGGSGADRPADSTLQSVANCEPGSEANIVWQRPALRLLVARGLIMTGLLSSVAGGYIRWMCLRSVFERCGLPDASLAATPLLALLSLLLGAPAGPQLLCLRHRRRLQLLLAWTRWRPPLLERVLLWPAEERARLLLAMVRLRAPQLQALSAPLQLLAAALVHWRRHAAQRCQRRHLLSALVTWMTLAPRSSVAQALGQRASAAGRRLASHAPELPHRFHQADVHLVYEMQYCYLAVYNINVALDSPLPMDDVHRVINGPLTLYVARELAEGEDTQDAAQRPKTNRETAWEADRRLETLLEDADILDALKQVADIIEAEAEWNGPVVSTPWQPLGDAGEAALHPDLRSARRLVGVLNGAVPSCREAARTALQQLTVTTEHGLYTLATVVCQRALATPSQMALSTWACLQLGHLMVKMEGRETSTVAFKQVLASVLLGKLRNATEGITLDMDMLQNGETGDQVLELAHGEGDFDVAAVAEEARLSIKMPGMGRFLAELFRADVLNDSFVVFCILMMTNARDETCLRWVCDILESCGSIIPSDCVAHDPERHYPLKNRTTILPEGLGLVPLEQKSSDPTEQFRLDWNFWEAPDCSGGANLEAAHQGRTTRPYAWLNPKSLLLYRQVADEWPTLDELVSKLEELQQLPSLSSPVRYRLKHVVSLSKRGWQGGHGHQVQDEWPIE